jgi:hypothetical protein
MGWINTLLASGVAGEVASSDPCDETVINGAPYEASRTIRSGADNPVAGPDALIAEEIKRRQIALVTRYVATVRAR